MIFEDGRKYKEETGEKLPYQIKLDLWETAFGLQKTDGLSPSERMVALAKEHIEGALNYQEVYQTIKQYYDEEVQATDRDSSRQEEADIASLRIVEILSTSSFSLTPSILIHYHQKLFEGIESFRYPVGKYRQNNISKDEPVLSGRSVQYQIFELLTDTMNWEFEQEKKFSYKGLSKKEVANHAMRFVSNVWQIHPFREGNTRTIAVFTIQYLRSFGFDVNNEPFKNHSQYFRDSLALSNDLTLYQTDIYLERFTENLLFGGKHKLTRKNIFVEQLFNESSQQSGILREGLKKLPEEQLEKAMLLSDEEKKKLFELLIEENKI